MYKYNGIQIALSYRRPRVLSASEINKCYKYIESQINKYLSETNAKSFTVKDIFGYDKCNWSEQHEPLQCIYEAWINHYIKIHPRWTSDEIYAESYKQSAISLGHLVKQVVGMMSNKKFVISNPSGWNIVYKVVV